MLLKAWTGQGSNISARFISSIIFPVCQNLHHDKYFESNKNPYVSARGMSSAASRPSESGNYTHSQYGDSKVE